MVELKFIIDDLKFEEFKTGFLKSLPVPEDSGLTENKWIKEWIKNQLLNVYKSGKVKIARETTTPEVDYDIITE